MVRPVDGEVTVRVKSVGEYNSVLDAADMLALKCIEEKPVGVWEHAESGNPYNFNEQPGRTHIIVNDGKDFKIKTEFGEKRFKMPEVYDPGGVELTFSAREAARERALK
jgi:hypothetical protein